MGKASALGADLREESRAASVPVQVPQHGQEGGLGQEGEYEGGLGGALGGER